MIWKVLLVLPIVLGFPGLKPETTMTFTQLCQHLNYPVSSHYVTTPDGYILHLYRIASKNSNEFSNSVPVFMQHGLIDSSDNWIVNDESLAPGFILANKGYDVWLGNTRGNRHSRNNTHLTPKDPEFWNYSWQNMSEFDIPTEINYVLNYTGYPKLAYIGHSQGTTIMMAHLSEHPEFAQKLYVAALLAPVASIKHQTSGIVTVFSHSELLELVRTLGIHELFENKGRYLLSFICEWFDSLCADGLYLMADANTTVDNVDRMQVIMGHYPSGTSYRNMQHWTQMSLMEKEGLPKFDYGSPEANMAHYGQKAPPTYDFSRISAKLGLFGGKFDRLADMTDVAWLHSQLVNAEVLHYKNDYPLGHGSFMWAKNMDWFNDVISLIEQVTSN